MCTNKRYITNSYGKRLLVKCGHCDACKQEKAFKIAFRIKNTMSKDYLPLFVTLTYDNRFVPYIRYEEVFTDTLAYAPTCNIYRDNSISLVRSDEDYNLRYKIVKNRVVLQTIELPIGRCNTDKFVSLHGQDDFNKISVCYYPDIQNFVKRLRINLYRDYGFSEHFKFFSCSEYGPSSQRAHAHLLLFMPVKALSFSEYKNAVIKSWPYGDICKSQRVQIAKNVASYLASYVNSSNSLPSLFMDCREISPKHSFSKMFGIENPSFRLDKIMENFFRGSCRYGLQDFGKKSKNESFDILPEYVVYRYFPKFKGFGRLTTDQILDVVTRPANVFKYSKIMQLKKGEGLSIYTMLKNKHKYCDDNDFDLDSYVFVYSRIWSLRASEIYKDFALGIHNYKEWFTAFDNIEDLYKTSVRNYSLEDFMLLLPLDFPYLVNFNEFPQNVAKTKRLESLAASYSKDKKCRDFIFNQNNYVNEY